ncbi:MAG: YolD-like family protein [Clostridia bacterium]|nr:YolD-like family protein [Clostridia bacterium]
MSNDDLKKYDDIIDLPHPVSKKHPQMPLLDRAAQFAPFAALTGYGEALTETARLTDTKIELDEGEIERINAKINYLIDNLETAPTVEITYFVPDKKKKGGKYLTKQGTVKKINDFEKVIVMTDLTVIPFDDILSISGGDIPEY